MNRKIGSCAAALLATVYTAPVQARVTVSSLDRCLTLYETAAQQASDRLNARAPRSFFTNRGELDQRLKAFAEKPNEVTLRPALGNFIDATLAQVAPEEMVATCSSDPKGMTKYIKSLLSVKKQIAMSNPALRR